MRILMTAAAIGALIISATAVQAAPAAKKKDAWCDWSFEKKMATCQARTGGAGRCGPWVNAQTNQRCR